MCQPPSGIADVVLPSSASRSALRAALWVTAVPSIRWVAAVSGWGPDAAGIVTETCCCRPRWRAGSYGVRPCEHATPRDTRRVRGRGWRAGGRGRGRSRGRSDQRPRGASGGWSRPGCKPRRAGVCCTPSGSTATLRLPDSIATAAGPASPLAPRRWGTGRGSRRSPRPARRR